MGWTTYLTLTRVHGSRPNIRLYPLVEGRVWSPVVAVHPATPANQHSEAPPLQRAQGPKDSCVIYVINLSVGPTIEKGTTRLSIHPTLLSIVVGTAKSRSAGQTISPYCCFSFSNFRLFSLQG
jgi:hypothetical protein